MMFDYLKTIPAAVTIADKDNVIIYMNDKSIEVFKNEGGIGLIGQNLFDCHNENSRLIMTEILNTGKPNSYTIEKNGIKKFIYQAKWYDDNNQCGLIEFTCEIPFELPHFIRG